MIKNIENFPIVKESLWDKEGLIDFERRIADAWEGGNIRGPIHLSGGNEEQIIEVGFFSFFKVQFFFEFY